MTFDDFLSRLQRVVQRPGQKAIACCPAHEDKKQSLSVSVGEDGRILVHCFAGCKPEDICAALGLKLSDLMPEKEPRTKRVERRIVKNYDYRDEGGKLLFQVVRYDPKGFAQRRPLPGDDWAWNLLGVRRVLYRLPELVKAKRSRVILIVEGEKDADRLAELGFLSTTAVGGAGHAWDDEWTAVVAGHPVVIVPDNDPPGLQHAQKVATAVRERAASVRMLGLPGLKENEDVSDWLNRNHTADELKALISATPVWEPPPDAPKEVRQLPPSPQDPGRRFPRTDAGNGEMFAMMYGELVRYDHRRKRWLLWEQHRWTPDCEQAIRKLARDVARERVRRAADLKDSDEMRKEVAWALQGESRQRVEACLYFAQAEKPVSDPGTDWDGDPYLLGCPNGVVDLRLAEMRAGRPGDRITMSTHVDYDDGALAGRWEKFLREVFSDDDDLIDWIERSIGYSATGDMSEQVFFEKWGKGANGKGEFDRALQAALGDYAANTPFSTVELDARSAIPNDLAALSGRRFVTASETNEGTRLNESRVKALTGGDQISARFLNQEWFSYRPSFKLWLSVNHKPRVRDDSYAFWRRVRLIPFTRTFGEHDREAALEQTLRDQAPGILASVVRGAVRWWKEKLARVPSSVLAATDEYRTESDDLQEFLTQRCVLHQDQFSSGSDLYGAYAEWCEANNLSRYERLGRKTFAQRLADRFPKSRTNTRILYLGIGVARSDQMHLPDRES